MPWAFLSPTFAWKLHFPLVSCLLNLYNYIPFSTLTLNNSQIPEISHKNLPITLFEI